VCNGEFEGWKEFANHMLVRKKTDWGDVVEEMEKKHKIAFDKSKAEGYKQLFNTAFKAKCYLCGGEIEAYKQSDTEAERVSWLIRCKNCGELFDED